MGELPPSRSTPQGPGVPWALRPRFPRVDSSRTSRVLLSRSVLSHFAHLLSLRGSPPSSRSPFLLLAILTIPLHGPIQLPPRISPPLFVRVSLRFLPFPCVQFSPVLSTFVLFGSPAVFPPTWRSDYPPFSFQITGSTAAFSRLGFCGPRVAPKRPHTSSKEAAKFTGQAALNKPF